MENRLDERLCEQTLRRDARLPEQAIEEESALTEQSAEDQIQDELALLKWNQILRSSAGGVDKATGKRIRVDEDKCTCRHFPFRLLHARQSFAGPQATAFRAASLRQFESLQKNLSVYADKRTMALNGKIREQQAAIAHVIDKLKRCSADTGHAFSIVDIRMGNNALDLLRLLQDKRPTLAERPAWVS